MNFLRNTLLTNRDAAMFEVEDLESGSRTANSSSHQPATPIVTVVTERPLAPELLSSSAPSLIQLDSEAPLSPLSNQPPLSNQFHQDECATRMQSVTITPGSNQSGLAPSLDTFLFSSPQTAISTKAHQSLRKRTHQIEENDNRVRIIESGPTKESTKQLEKVAKQHARTVLSRTVGEEYSRKAGRLTQEANQFAEEMRKRAEETTRRTVEEANRFVEEANGRAEEANRRAEEANRRVEEMIRDAQEAKESFITELERRRLEEENRVKEIAEQTSKAIAAAEARSQVAEQQSLEATKMAEEKYQKVTREASNLRDAFMETMKRFNTNPIRKVDGRGIPREGMVVIVGSDSENEVLHSLSQISVPDDDEPMSLATFPPDSESLESEEPVRGGISRSKAPSHGIAETRGEDAAITNKKGKKKDQSVPQLPPPRKFHRPRGGQHPINIRVNPASDIDLEAVEENQEPIHRRRQKKRQDFFSHAPLRGSNEARTQSLREVRELMNELLHIKKDEEVNSIESATIEDVLGFLDGTHEGPTLDPMHVFFKKIDRTEGLREAVKYWNSELAELFVDRFEGEMEKVLLNEERVCIGDLFLERLGRLTRKWQECKRLTEEEKKIKKMKYHKAQRTNSRRVELYDTRWNICHGNLKNRDGTMNLGWKATLKMIEVLKAAGMSSDESEMDEATGKVTYIVKKRAWRSKEVLDRLKLVDQDRNTTNAYGGARAGNPPRVRRRIPYAKESIRPAMPNCPKNFYAREFVANISSYRVLNELNEQPAVDLGYLEEDSDL